MNESQVRQYIITTAAGSVSIEASNMNAAARIYDPAINTMDELFAKIINDGGWITLADDDLIGFRGECAVCW